MKTKIYKFVRKSDGRVSYFSERFCIGMDIDTDKDVYECIVDIPEEFDPIEMPSGKIFVTVDDKSYELDVVLGKNENGDPAIRWDDEDRRCTKTFPLKVHEIK